jgi:pyruvate/2-oxoglutarate/acetoin dehydrogenase E1 component
MEPVIIYRTFNLAEAQLMRSRLEGAGIEATVEHEQSATNLDVAVGGVRVVVSSDKAEEARAFLKE